MPDPNWSNPLITRNFSFVTSSSLYRSSAAYTVLTQGMIRIFARNAPFLYDTSNVWCKLHVKKYVLPEMDEIYAKQFSIYAVHGCKSIENRPDQLLGFLKVMCNMYTACCKIV